jgi:hypothetical protein
VKCTATAPGNCARGPGLMRNNPQALRVVFISRTYQGSQILSFPVSGRGFRMNIKVSSNPDSDKNPLEPPVKKINAQYRKVSERKLQLKAGTGSHCPTNGFWRAEDSPAEPVFVFEGSMMPPGRRGTTMWYLDDNQSGPPAYLLPGT